MQRAIRIVFGDNSKAPFLSKIEPNEDNVDRECSIHVLKINGMKAVLDGYGPNGFYCTDMYRCQDQSPFARMLRVFSITERNGAYMYGGRQVPDAEIAKIRKLSSRGRG